MPFSWSFGCKVNRMVYIYEHTLAIYCCVLMNENAGVNIKDF